jgi:membrane-bound metal-dependent hydrolase YbcI (DUF457 family)
MRKEQHLIFASVVGYLLVELLSLQGVSVIDNNIIRVMCAVLCMLGALIPDKIEKPKYWHRKLFHSKLFLFCLVVMIYAFRNYVLFVAFLCGYVSHLLLDWGTKRGLPNY